MASVSLLKTLAATQAGYKTMSIKARTANKSAAPAYRVVLVSVAACAVALNIGLASNVMAQSAPAAKTAVVATTTDSAARNLIPMAQPLWSDLKPAQQSVLKPFEAQWNSYPQANKLSWLKVADQFAKLSPAQQELARERIKQWSALTPEQRRLARANFSLAKKAPSTQRVAEFAQYQGMTAEQKLILRTEGSTSNTAVKYAGVRSGLAPEAAQPISKPATPITKKP
jgi:Protein of unknown function (DUF3106)